MTRVKICGLTTCEDARWAWHCGADLLGFVFVESSPRCVEMDMVAQITETLTQEGCRAHFVGVFADAPAATIRHTVRVCGLHHAQLHGHESPEEARASGVSTIIARRVREQVPWEELARYDAWAYLLDSHDPQRLGGTGRAWRWDLLAEDKGAPRRKPRLIVAGGLTPDNVAQAIQKARPWGVDVSSGVEAASARHRAEPGRKDPERVARFIRAVRKEDEKPCV